MQGALFNFNRDDCDSKFRDNLLRRCELVEDEMDVIRSNACKAAANSWFTSVKVAGAFAFKSKDKAPDFCQKYWVKLCV